MRALRFFRWTLVPVALFAAYLTLGLPHMRWSYDWRDDGQGYEPMAARFFTRCTFAGPYGQFTFHKPPNGECAWIIFRKSPQQ